MHFLPFHDEFDKSVADDTHQVLGEEFFEEVLDGIYRGEDLRAKRHLRELEAGRLAAQFARAEHRLNPDMRPEFRVPASVYHDWAWFFRDANDKADYSCWSDDEFVREMLRDNPEIRVQTETRQNFVGWSRAVEAPRGLVLTDERGNVAA